MDEISLSLDEIKLSWMRSIAGLEESSRVE
jgi:hypothetical protein